MKKIKEFFSPVEGGPLHGLEFNKWVIHFQRGGLFLTFPLVMIYLVIFEGPIAGEWDPVWFFYAAESFLGLIWLLHFWKGIIQHWSDLKNHTSR